MTIFLIQVGRSRFELYSEAPEEAPPSSAAERGVFSRWAHAANLRWQDVVENARQGSGSGILAHMRDALVRRVAESIAEQRTLWALRRETTATLRFPSTLDFSSARRVLAERFDHATRHHRLWLIIDSLLLLASAVFAVLPGPNVIAYYLAFRVFGHLSSWRGARRADHITWQLEADDSLAELAQLAAMPRDARAPRVADIARRLNLSRLPTFFERMAT